MSLCSARYCPILIVFCTTSSHVPFLRSSSGIVTVSRFRSGESDGREYTKDPKCKDALDGSGRTIHVYESDCA
jgi:hypothetical protein